MKSLMLLWKMVAHECATWCNTSATMDCKTVLGRSKTEGLSFLTITLPTFGKDFERSLDQGKVDRNLFQGFSWKGGLPKFLWGFLDLIFDRTSGVLLDDPSIDAIRSVRQLTLMFGKMHLPCTPKRVDKAYAGYIQCEQELRVSDAALDPSYRADFEQIGDLLFRHYFREVDRLIYLGDDIVPKHGPGSTADGLLGNRKYRGMSWTRRLEDMFPCGDYLLPNHRYYDDLDDVQLLEPRDEIPAKVISVPKTQKTPRIIAMEPAAVQYVQQGILELMLRSLEKQPLLNEMIGIRDQEPNRLMAQKGSLDGNLATLDLSEASDRVSNQHVRLLMRHYPWFSKGVDACRSRKADVPGYGVIRLAKFASMGSALCFPIEAMVFLTIVFVGIQRSLNTHLTPSSIRRLRSSVRVFGDDIIVPVDHVSSVVRALQAFGLVVNTTKSFWNGSFRESCGKEYFKGNDVSIVKVRELFPSRRTDATGVISLVSLRNQLYWSGYWRTVAFLDDHIRDLIKHFPTVEPSSPVLGRESCLGYETQRTHEHLHSPLVKGYVVSAKPPRNSLDGSAALLKYFIKRGNEPTQDEDHLERSGRPSAVYTKLRWASPF